MGALVDILAILTVIGVLLLGLYTLMEMAAECFDDTEE